MKVGMNRARLFCCLCAGLWLAAFFLSLPLLRPYEIPRLVCIGCVFSAAGLALGWRLSSPEGLSWPRSRLLLVAGLFWLVIVASVFTSAIPFVAFIAACSFSLLPCGVLLSIAVPERELFIRICAWGGGFILFVVAAAQFAQMIAPSVSPVHGGLRWPFANPNTTGALLLLGFFPGLGIASRGECRRTALLLAALALGGIMVLDGIGIMAALAGGIAVFAALAHRAGPSRRDAALLSFVGLLFFYLPDIMPVFNAVFHTHIGTPVTVVGPPLKLVSVHTRLYIWRAALAMIAQHPFLGTGIGTFFLYYPQFRLGSEVQSSGLMAHSDPLQFWAEAGMLAPLMFYAFLALAGARMRAALQKLPLDSPVRAAVAGLFCALAAFVAHAHIDFDLNQPSILLVSGLLLGIWHEMTGEVIQERRKRLALPVSWPENAGWALALLPVIAILFVLQGFLLSERYVNRASDELDRGDITAFAADVNRAGRVGFGMNARAYVMAAGVPIETVESPFALLPGDAKKPDYEKAEDLLAKAEARNPRLVAIPYDRARLARNRNDRAAQEMYLKQALMLNPAHLPSRVMLASLYNREGKNPEGLKILKDALAWPRVKGGGAEGASDYFNMLLILGAARNDSEAMAAGRAGLILLYGPQGATLTPQVPVR